MTPRPGRGRGVTERTSGALRLVHELHEQPYDERCDGETYERVQRINRADTDLTAEGNDADTWLDIAQCFAGPSGEGGLTIKMSVTVRLLGISLPAQGRGIRPAGCPPTRPTRGRR